MKKTRPACPVCGSPEVAHRYSIARHNFSVHSCAACGSEFQYPLPKNADAYYDEGYYTGTSRFSYQDERSTERYHNYVHFARLRTIRKFGSVPPALPPPHAGGSGRPSLREPKAEGRKLLDVGCAFGAFVRAAAHDGEAYGLDVSGFAVREGNKISVEANSRAQLFAGDLTHLPKSAGAKRVFIPGTFTAITLIEVAEHLAEPRPALEQAYRLLAPGGVLVIQTANYEGWQAVNAQASYHYYLPGHLVYYTATGLKRMLSAIGFHEFREFFPTDFPLWAKWRKAWGEIKKPADLLRYWRMTLYHIRSKLRWRGRPLTSSYVLYARK